MPAQTRYVTVDLIVKGNDATESFSAFLGAKNYYVQHHEWNDDSRWYLNISCPRDFENADQCIEQYCNDLEQLPDDAKAEWEQARFREFSIGYHVAGAPRCFENHLSETTIQRVSKLGAGIGITLYPCPDAGE
jgi:hypothetical protein